ncbi:Transposase [bacterium YEK0313]|nr:Transposase [bacterium YEK0313]CEJ11516.1 Transposase [bacterium YEK0313]CEJ15794.1 Transposase [bacterium YEK0313]
MGLQVHRVFSVAFKAAALRRVEAGEALATVARDLKVERKLLYDWRRAYETGGLAGLENRKPGRKPGLPMTPEERALKPPPDLPGDLAQAHARIAELERKIGRQQMDLDFFRRALHLAGGPEAQVSTASASTRPSKK